MNQVDSEVMSFPSAGYSIARKGQMSLIFDAGPLGYPAMAAHGHADALSFCLAVDDQWWLVDPGTYTYHTEHLARDYFRGTRAHNTLTVNAENQSQIGGPFMWVRNANARMCPPQESGSVVRFSGSHDGYERIGVGHQRELRLDHSALTLAITDEVSLVAGTEATLELNFHFDPEVALSLDGNVARAQRADSNRQILMALDANWKWETFRGSEAPMTGWYSPKLGVKVPAWTLRGTKLSNEPLTVSTCLSVVTDE